MMQILVYPEKALREVSTDIVSLDAETLAEIEDLKKILLESENGAGLAANQIGVKKRFFGLKKNSIVEILINPKILKTYGERVFPKIVSEDGKEVDFLEGCLSFPNFYGTVKRYLKIEVETQDLKLKSHKKVLAGFEAIVFQHEFDHLDGKLFVDGVKKDKGKLFLEKDKKMVKWNVNKVI